MEVKVMLDAIDKYELVHKNLRLVKVDSDNCFDLADLSIKEDQIGFVAPNQESMALAFGTLNEGKYVEAFGLYDGGIPVGFVMIGHNSFDFEGCPSIYKHSYYLWRFMIDKEYQGQRYGKDAAKLVLDYILTFPDGEEETIATSYEEDNIVSMNLWKSFGFVPNGEISEGKDADEVVLVLRRC